MAVRRIEDGKLTAIANAIRAKTGSTGTLKVDAMPAAIAGIAASLPAGITVGSFKASSSSGDMAPPGGFTIEHGLGKVPEAVLVWRIGAASASFINGGVFYAHIDTCTLYAGPGQTQTTGSPSLTATGFLVPKPDNSSLLWFGTYVWAAVG